MVIESLYLLAARDRFVAGEREELRRGIQLGIAPCERGEVVEAGEACARPRERMRPVEAPVR
jgi:hypothetical protein